MSGAPVVDADGTVRGMSVATLTRTIPQLDGQPTVISNGIVVDVEHLQAFIADNRKAFATAG